LLSRLAVHLSSLDKVPDEVDKESNHEADQKNEGNVEDSTIAEESSIFPWTAISVVEIVDQVDSGWNGKTKEQKINNVEARVESSVGGQKEFNE